jgi:hypothetical protein
MDTLRFRGPVAKHLTVLSNDPENPKLELTISARVTPLVEITPRAPAQITVVDEAVTREFTLVRTGGRPMKVLQVTPTAPYLKTELVPLSGEGSYKLTVTVTPEVPLGRTLNVVVIQTDLPKQSEQRISLLVNRGIITSPPAVYWSVTPDGKPLPDRSVVTISRPTGQFHVTGVTSDDPKLQVKVEPVRDGAEYSVTVSYSGNWAPGMARKTLTVTTDDPKQPTLKIPIQVVTLPTASNATSLAVP